MLWPGEAGCQRDAGGGVKGGQPATSTSANDVSADPNAHVGSTQMNSDGHAFEDNKLYKTALYCYNYYE